MKKLFILIISLFMVGAVCYGAENYAAENVVNMFGRGGPEGLTPGVQIIKVRYGYVGGTGRNEIGLQSGDVVCWDTNSADGYTISACTTENASNFAGVLVTDISTADSVLVRGSGNNVGWIAIKGFCLAHIDTSKCTAGERLFTGGQVGDSDGGASFITTSGLSAVTGRTISNDVGLLLTDSGSDLENAAVILY